MSLQQLGGIKTDLFAIEKYVDEVVEEIKKEINVLQEKVHKRVLMNVTEE